MIGNIVTYDGPSRDPEWDVRRTKRYIVLDTTVDTVLCSEAGNHFENGRWPEDWFFAPWKDVRVLEVAHYKKPTAPWTTRSWCFLMGHDPGWGETREYCRKCGKKLTPINRW